MNVKKIAKIEIKRNGEYTLLAHVISGCKVGITETHILDERLGKVEQIRITYK